MKLLVDPLFWSILFLLGVPYLYRTYKRRCAVVLLSVAISLLIVFSLPVVSRILRSSLHPTIEGYTTLAHYIFTLSGGYYPGSVPSEDVLTPDSQRRVLHAVDVWQRQTDAILVMSGRSHSDDPDRETELMVEVARSRGVPSDKILMETKSISTREHPIEVLKLPNVYKDSPVIIVTSDWHMRRAGHEFCRYFSRVFMDPVVAANLPLKAIYFLPSAGALAYNTVLLREWFGLAWYSLIGAVNPSIPAINNQCIS